MSASYISQAPFAALITAFLGMGTGIERAALLA